MKSCVIQRDVMYVSSTAIVLILLYTFPSSAYGQSSAPFANCISFSMKHSFVQLNTDEDCSEQQFAEAVTYYKAHGYPAESSSMDLMGTKALQLQSEEMAKNEQDLMK